MKTLLIDTHLFDIHILLFDKYEIISEEHIIGQKHNSQYLLPAIKKVCDKSDFDQIIVVNGPGSFTGVRLGVTVAKTLAYTLNKPIKAISSLDLLNYSSDNKEHIYGIGDGNGYFIGEYNNNILSKDFYYISNNQYLDIKDTKNIETDVFINYKSILKFMENIKNENPHSINPLYIKLIGVENDKKN